MRVPRTLYRTINRARSRLALTGAIDPLLRGPAYEAHESLFRFVSGYVNQSSVLIINCDAGFGPAAIDSTGRATRVLATDENRRCVSFAQRRYRSPRMSVERLSVAGTLDRVNQKFDVVVLYAFTLERIDAELIGRMKAALATDGVLFVLARPDQPLATPGAKGSAPAPEQWGKALRQSFRSASVFAQQPRNTGLIGFRYVQGSSDDRLPGDCLSVVYLATDREGFAERRLHVGSGPQLLPGFINMDNQPYAGVDHVWDLREGLPYRQVARIFAEHFIEHLRFDDALALLRECRRALAPDGVIRLSTPNLDWVVRVYRFGGSAGDAIHDCMVMNRAFRGWGHHYIYNLESLVMLLHQAGFETVRPQQYGISDDPVFSGIERHERYPDDAATPHVIIVEARGVRSGPAEHIDVMDDYRRDVAVV